jgi:hypothetical protein
MNLKVAAVIERQHGMPQVVAAGPFAPDDDAPPLPLPSSAMLD